MAKKRKEKYVVAEIGGYVITAENIMATDNRNNDLVKLLTWASTNIEIVDDNKEFVKDIISFTNQLASKLIDDGEDETYAKAWKEETVANIKKTYKDASTLKKKNATPNMVMCFENCDVTLPFELSNDYRSDIIKAMDYITSQPDIIEGDVDFALELKERVSAYAKEMNVYGKHVPKDESWSAWKERLCANVDKSLALWKISHFKNYDLSKRVNNIGEVRARLQNLHGLFLEKVLGDNNSKKKTYIYKIFDYDDNVVAEFKTMRSVYDYEFELSTKLLEIAKGA